jgi:ABC-type lipoprotein release transport system permease subunit
VIRSLLFGVQPFDPYSFALASVVLAGATLAAMILPAVRASRVDPVVTLRAG